MTFCRRILTKAFLALAGLVCQLSFGEVINLACKDKTSFTVNFKIDTKLKTVTHRGLLARDVLIDDETINFTTGLDESWFHSINRANGTLSIVRISTNSLLEPYICERAKNRF